jgi:hypothetical protein
MTPHDTADTYDAQARSFVRAVVPCVAVSYHRTNTNDGPLDCSAQERYVRTMATATSMSPAHATTGERHCLHRPTFGDATCCLCGCAALVVELGGDEHDVALLLCQVCLRWLLELVTAYTGRSRP